MIISIEISVTQANEQPLGKLEEFFSEVLRSSRRGHHIIIVPRSLARWAMDNIHLSGHDQAHLERVREEFTQIGSLRNDPASRVLKVVSLHQELQAAGDHAWSIGIEEILDSRFLDKPVLLLENATNDGELYNELLSHEARRRGIQSLAYQVANGGGGTTFQEVTRFANLKHIVVCVCDHDQLTPYSQSSETYTRAAATANSIGLVGTVLATPGREIENFLPLDLLIDLFPDYLSAQKTKLEGLISAQGAPQSGDCLWLFFDVKEGVCSAKLRQKCNSNDARGWAEAKYQIDDLEDDNTAIDGFGQNVVGRLLGNGAALAKMHKFTRSPYWKQHFATWFDTPLPFLQSRPNSRV